MIVSLIFPVPQNQIGHHLKFGGDVIALERVGPDLIM